MVLSERSFIYYIKKKSGKCFIMEGNPRDPRTKNHEPIFSLKANNCLAFNVQNQDTFFFMDDQYVVYMLTRNDNDRSLTILKELTMREIQRLDFNPIHFDNVLLTERYVIQGSKTFYLYDLAHEPFIEGIFEAENLIEQTDKSRPENHHIGGSFKLECSQKFFNIYQFNKFKSFINIQRLPDQTE